MWTEWPNRQVTGIMKGYMLCQLAFWLQQVLAINIEEWRKDHWQMLSHHIITIALIIASYRYGHTRVGTVILVLMDVGDLVFGVGHPTGLPSLFVLTNFQIAKCLKYTGHDKLCDVAFGVFMFAWFFCRHVCYNIVCYSVAVQTPHIMTVGCFRGTGNDVIGPMPIPEHGSQYLVEPFTDSEGLVCYDSKVKWSFLAALLSLQAIMIVWFFMIIRVAIRVLRGEGADDGRSDEEDDGLEDEDDEEFVYEEATPLEEEVGVGEIDLKAWERRAGSKRQTTSASGVSLPGHSDRKELLGRIGCEKQVD
jgi:very-long-chain ceramide synthase